MPRILGFILFFSVFLAVIGGLHYYFWVRLVRDVGLSPGLRWAATAALVALGLSLPVTFLTARALPRDVAPLLAWPAYIWMGLMLILAMVLLAADLVRWGTEVVRIVAGGPAPPDPGRRVLLQQLLSGGAVVAAGGVGAIAVRTALRPVEVRELRVPLARLPRALHGTTIVQLTDVHIGPTLGRAFLEEVVRRTNALAPDVIAITGDLVDDSVERLRDAVAPLGRLRARHGVYFVTGNHEYYAGADPWIAELERLGLRVLRNQRVSIGDGNGASFDLAGIDDHSARRMAPGHGADLGRALAGHDPTREVVLLAHQPKAIHEAARRGVGLVLSGHTHGGQIWPWGYLVRLQQPYVVGLFRHGPTQLYVSPGTGYWGPPMRLGSAAEITRVILESPA